MSIRMATPDDAEALLSIYAPYVTNTAVTFECECPTPSAFARRMEEIGATYPYLVWEEDGAVGGYAYACAYRQREAYRWAVETSIYLDKSFQGRGVAKALYGELLDRLCKLHYHTAFGIITLPNEKSVALHRHFGFEEAGIWRECGFKLGRWHDVICLQKTLQDAPEAPQEPLRP